MSNSEKVRRRSFSPQLVNRVVTALRRPNITETRKAWLSAVCARVSRQKPLLSPTFSQILGVEPRPDNLLNDLEIGEIGVCYEALLADLNPRSRRIGGQFFTPDDAARFMAECAATFPSGTWLDPCCGVGNLAWHLAAVQPDPAKFVGEQLILMDKDKFALLSAVALIAGEYVNDGNDTAVRHLYSVSQPPHNALTKTPLPAHDYVIMNPPYAHAVAPACITHTASCRDTFTYFMERVTLSSRGFVAVTPASYLSSPKFSPLRELLKGIQGGDVYVFDNVPDTLFRGYKYGSNNTSKTNFVRAAITVCPPGASSWRITPILRWKATSRARLLESAHSFLAPRHEGPHGEWVKLMPGTEMAWDRLINIDRRLSTLVTDEDTPWHLDIALTPRYYISASTRTLNRSSKAVLHFPCEETRNLAMLVLNSSIPYLMWRALDGGVTLPYRVLMDIPIPDLSGDHSDLISRIFDSERKNVVTKLNAGRDNENVHHPERLVREINHLVIPEIDTVFDLLYTADMFADRHPSHQLPLHSGHPIL